MKSWIWSRNSSRKFTHQSWNLRYNLVFKHDFLWIKPTHFRILAIKMMGFEPSKWWCQITTRGVDPLFFPGLSHENQDLTNKPQQQQPQQQQPGKLQSSGINWNFINHLIFFGTQVTSQWLGSTDNNRHKHQMKYKHVFISVWPMQGRPKLC